MTKTVSIVKNDLSVLVGKSAKEIENMYFAELLTATLLLRQGDSVAENLLTDSHGKDIKHYSRTSTQLNALGHVINNPKSIHAKEYLTKGVIKQLDTDSGRILESTFKELHKQISTPKNGTDFSAINDALRIISLRLELRSTKLNHIRFVLENWHQVSATEKSTALNALFVYMYKYNKDSNLFQRLRLASTDILLKANKKSDTVVKFSKLDEEDASMTTVGTTSSGDVATVEKRIFKGKMIKRMKRNYFPKPKFLKNREE